MEFLDDSCYIARHIARRSAVLLYFVVLGYLTQDKMMVPLRRTAFNAIATHLTHIEKAVVLSIEVPKGMAFRIEQTSWICHGGLRQNHD